MKIIFGKEVKKYGNKVLLHYGGGSIKESGLYNEVIESLRVGEIEYIELSGVKPNPVIAVLNYVEKRKSSLFWPLVVEV